MDKQGLSSMTDRTEVAPDLDSTSTLFLASMDNRGLAYGDGFFSTMGIREGQILWVDYHQKRLITHAKALQLTVNVANVMQDLTQKAKQVGEGLLKIIITRKPQTVRGYGFANGDVEVVIVPKPMAIYAGLSPANAFSSLSNIPIQSPISAICLTTQIGCLPPPLVGLKTLNRLDNVLASGELESKKSGYIDLDYPLAEGLVQDLTGSWIEGTMSNVFYQLDEADNGSVWYTPPIDKSGVNGVMRQVLMDKLCQDKPNGVCERPLQDTDLANDLGNDLGNVTALFFTNAVRGIIPVATLILPTGEVKKLTIKSDTFNF